MKKAIKLILCLFMLTLTIPTINVKAESVTTTSTEKGTIDIAYFDDSQQTVPVVDSTWRLFKVGNITTTTDENGVNSLEITSNIKGLEITRETTPEEVMAMLKYKVLTESQLNIGYKTINGEVLEAYDTTTNEAGHAFVTVPEGVYLGVEIRAAKYHVRSTPFLISMPWTNEEGNISYLKKRIEPKAVTAGNVVVTKKTYGNDTDPDVFWNMTVKLPKGRYFYQTTRGRMGFIESTGVVGIRAYTSMTIFNVPAGHEYIVEEAEANADGYKTWYDNQTGVIKEKTNNEVIVHNERYKDVDTASGKDLIKYMTIMALATGGLIYFMNKGRKSEEE